MQIVW